MVVIDKDGYLTRKNPSTKPSGRPCGNKPNTSRNWWLVKHRGYPETTGAGFNLNICLPKEYIGKKVRFKVEIIE